MQLANFVSAPDLAGDDNPGVQSSQPERAADSGVDEAPCVVAETRRELGAAEVRLGADLDDC